MKRIVVIGGSILSILLLLSTSFNLVVASDTNIQEYNCEKHLKKVLERPYLFDKNIPKQNSINFDNHPGEFLAYLIRIIISFILGILSILIDWTSY